MVGIFSMLQVRVIVNGEEPVYGRHRFADLGYVEPERFQVVPYDGSVPDDARMMSYRGVPLTPFEISLILSWKSMLESTTSFPALLCESDAWPLCTAETMEELAGTGYDIVRPFKYCRWGSPVRIHGSSHVVPFHSVADRLPPGRPRERFFWGTHAILFCTRAGASEFGRWLDSPDSPADWIFSDMAVAGDVDIGVTSGDLVWQYDTRKSWREGV